TSIQIIHLHKARAGESWKIVEFEEVADASASFAPRTGTGPFDGADDDAAAVASSLLPVSRLAPARDDHDRVTRLKLRLSRRDGSAFQSVPQGASQRL